MRKFISTLFLFLLPIFLALIIPTLFLGRSKEMFYNLDKTIAKNNKYIIGYAYDESNYKYLKWKKVTEFEKYTVLALGSSRTLQFRSNMFNVPFYNAGYTIYGLNDFKAFLQSVPKVKYPGYLIISLDQWMFNTSWDNLSSNTDINMWKDSFIEYPKTETFINVYTDLLKRKYGFKLLMGNSSTLIGLNALVNNKGFRNDGSMLYGAQIRKLESNDPTADDYNFTNTYKLINDSVDRYKYASNINPKSIKVINNFLTFCHANKIKVVAFLPPFSEKVLTKMANTKKYNYMGEIYNSISPLFKRFNYELYDFTKPSGFNSNDSEMLDGMHGGEKAYLKMLIWMLDHNSSLRDVCNKAKLQTDLSNANSKYIIYPY
jgi:hypothetical protein